MTLPEYADELVANAIRAGASLGGIARGGGRGVYEQHEQSA